MKRYAKVAAEIAIPKNRGKDNGRLEKGNQFGQLIAKALTDEEFKARLKADPKAAMKEVGMDVPEGVEIEVLESTQEKAYLVREL